MKRIWAALFISLLFATSLVAESGPTLTQRASEALFVQSDSRLALHLAKSALKKNRHDAEAAFVAMEAAAVQADDEVTLDAALTLVAEAPSDDPRAEIAEQRIEGLAANSSTFRAQLARVQKMASSRPELRLALVAAANDGVPELNQLASSRDAGLVTDWRVVGPFGKSALLDFDKTFAAETDLLQSDRYGRRVVEKMQFSTGRFSLPDYFEHHGVYYAESEIYITSDGMWNVFIETSGTARIFVDGTNTVTRDERKSAQPELVRSLIHLTQGKHKLIVKFTASASPFRVAILPPTGGVHKKQNIPVLTAQPEAEYIIASLRLSQGNVVEALEHARAAQRPHESAISHWLLARCWKRVSEDAPDFEIELRASLELDASAPRVRLELAKQRLRSDRTEEGLALLKQVATAVPHNEDLLRVESKEFSRMAWREENETVLGTLVAEHPSCENLSMAASFYAASERMTDARRIEDRLVTCSSNALEGARAIAHRGDHSAAAEVALKQSRSAPFDRSLLEFALHETMLTGDAAAAYPIARQLADLSPNSERYQRLLDTVERGSTTFNEGRAAPAVVELLKPYRRDAIETIRQAAAKKYSGGPAVWTLNDGAVVDRNGERWLYTHRIVRLLNRDGVLSYGEVSVPRGAEVLHLRTIAANGQITEPEFNQHKATVSMPALAPGDSIEQEFLQITTGEETTFEFGSFDAPILYSRFTFIGSADLKPQTVPSKAPTKALVEGLVATTWEFNDVLQPVREVSLPSASQFPSVALAGEFATIDALREHAQEQLLAASVPGPRAFTLARELSGTSQIDTARKLYRQVMRSVESDEAEELLGDVTSGEESLENHEGDRAAALIALGRAAGIDVRVLLAREIGSNNDVSSYLHPIVEFRFSDGKTALADLENEGLPLGSVNPSLLTLQAVPILAFRKDIAEVSPAATVAVTSSLDEHSTANGKVEISADGTLHADVTIRMAPWRASQMRGVLRGVNAPDRPRFFQQLAMRLFPGATDAKGEIAFENDPDQPLSIRVVCSAPSFVDLHRHLVDIDQITPALGLRSMYAKSASRNYPLAIDAVLFESSVFKVTLPEGVTLSNGLEAQVKSEFGNYSTTVRQLAARVWEMDRDFNVPLQVVAPDHYEAFSAFATRIDSIERQRLSLRINRTQLQNVKLDHP